MKKILMFVFALLLFVGCSGGNEIPQPVCDYGEIVCNVSQTLCDTSLLPENLCYYLNLSCVNLEYLCSNNLTEKERDSIIISQNVLNDFLKNFVTGYKEIYDK